MLAAYIRVHIVELADRGVTCLIISRYSQVAIASSALGCHAVGKAVHQLAPAPEAVLSLATELGQTAERTLEGMRVQIGHAWDHRAGGADGGIDLAGLAALRIHIGEHLGQTPALVPAEQDICAPIPVGSKASFGKKCAAEEEECMIISKCLKERKPNAGQGRQAPAQPQPARPARR